MASIVIKYLAPILAVLAVLAWVDNRAYYSGKARAETICAEDTVPAALEALTNRYELLQTATKDENDALYRNAANLRATNDRLRKQKPIAACLPIACAGNGDTGHNGAATDSKRMGVSTEWLDDAFFDTASDIARGESCQRQLKRIYELNGAKYD